MPIRNKIFRSIVPLSLSLLFTAKSFSQSGQVSRQVDSLKTLIANSKIDTVKAKLYVAWDGLIYLSDPALDMKLTKKVLEMSTKNLAKAKLNHVLKKFWQAKRAWALGSYAIILTDKGKLDTAVILLRQAENLNNLNKEVGAN